MNETEIALPGVKKIAITLYPPAVIGRPPEIKFAWNGFENPNENMTRMEIASLLLGCATTLVNQEFQASVPQEGLHPEIVLKLN